MHGTNVVRVRRGAQCAVCRSEHGRSHISETGVSILSPFLPSFLSLPSFPFPGTHPSSQLGVLEKRRDQSPNNFGAL